MKKSNEETRQCKLCGKTIVGNNKTGICAACKKKHGDRGVATVGIMALVGGVVWTVVKALTKKD